MRQDAVQLVLARHRDFPEPQTLLVDDNDDLAATFSGEGGFARLSQAGLAPEEMWAFRGVGAMRLGVLSAPRTAREMFRVLGLAERLVSPEGRILLLPATDDAASNPGSEVRPEATEAFCGVYPEWSRRQVKGDVVELWRSNHLFVEQRASDKSVPVSFQQMPIEGVEFVGGWKRVVSLSVFGDCRFGTDFWKDMPAFVTNYVLAHHALFLGYALRIHHDEHLYHANGGDVLLGLARRGLVELVYIPSRPGQGKCERMLHRLLPAWDPAVEVVICRDVDSLPTWRDRSAVEEFVASGCDAHTILDSCSHTGFMGGLSAFRAASLRAIYPTFEAFIAAAGKTDAEWDAHGADQAWLNHIELERGYSRGNWGVLEHCLPREDDPRYGQLRGNQEMWREGRTVLSRREVAVFFSSKDFGVSHEVAEGSDALTNHLWSSGYDVRRARAFYDRYSPVAAEVLEAEMFAAGQRVF